MPNDIRINILGDVTLEKNVLQAVEIHENIKSTFEVWKQMSKTNPFVDTENTKNALTEQTKQLKEIEQAIKKQIIAEQALERVQKEANKELLEKIKIAKAIEKAQEEANKAQDDANKLAKENVSELQKLAAEIEAVKKANQALSKGNKQTSQEFIDNKMKLKELNEEYRTAEKLINLKTIADKEAEGSNQKLKASVSLLTHEYNKLSDSERENTEKGKKLTRELAMQVYQLKKNEEAVGDHRRSVGDYQKALGNAQTHLAFLLKTEKDVSKTVDKNSDEYKQLRQEIKQTTDEVRKYNSEIIKSSAKDAISSKVGFDLGGMDGIAGKLAIGGAAVGAAVAAGKALYDASVETNKIQQKVLNLFDLQGEALDNVTVKVKTLSEVYEKDYDEVIKAANTVSKEFGISASDALIHIEEGFAKGSDASGEFLDMLREYPAQFKAAGIDADLMFSIINKSATEGIYSDKGADAIKEGMLRLREMTPATQDALKAIGFTSEEVHDALKNGTLATWDGMKKVSSKLSELKENSPKVGQALADIFGGAGEDAGYGFITMLKDVDKNLDNTKETTTKLTKSQIELTEAWNRVVINASSDGGYLNTGLTAMLSIASKTLDVISTGSFIAADLLETAREVEAINKRIAKQKGQVDRTIEEEKSSKENASNVKNEGGGGSQANKEIIKENKEVTESENKEQEKRLANQKEFYKKQLDAAILYERMRIENMEEGFDKERDTENLRYKEALRSYDERFKGTKDYFKIVEEETEKHLKNLENIYSGVKSNTGSMGIDTPTSASEAAEVAKNINLKLNVQTTTNSQEGFDLAELLGVTDDQLSFVEDQLRYAYSAVMDFMSSLADARIADLEDQIAITDDKIENTERELDKEREARDKGYANNFALRQKELADLQKQKAEEEKELDKAQKAKSRIAKLEAIVSAAATSSNIILTGTELMKAHAGIPFVGVGIAAGLIATMLGMIAKLRASSRGYFDGIEFVPLGNNPKGRDTIPANLHEGERIVPTSINAKLKGVKNSDLPLILRQSELWRLRQNVSYNFGQHELNAHNNSFPFEYEYLRKQNELLAQNNKQLQKLVANSRNRTERVSTPIGYVEFTYADGVLTEKKEVTVK